MIFPFMLIDLFYICNWLCLSVKKSLQILISFWWLAIQPRNVDMIVAIEFGKLLGKSWKGRKDSHVTDIRFHSLGWIGHIGDLNRSHSRVKLISTNIRTNSISSSDTFLNN